MQQTTDPRVADLVRAGKIRVGLFPPQFTKDPATGEPRGVWVEIASALARRIGVEAVVVERGNPTELIDCLDCLDCLDCGECDVGSLGPDPSRTARVGGFSPPFIQMDYTFLLPAGSPIRCVADADRAGVRIAVVRNHASTLALSRILKRAEKVATDTADSAFDQLRRGRADVLASVRPVLLDYAGRSSGMRVIEDSYGANLPALVVAKGQNARLAYLSEFIEEAKASGLVQQAIERTGQAGYRVADLGAAKTKSMRAF